jgi:hypothetical protein
MGKEEKKREDWVSRTMSRELENNPQTLTYEELVKMLGLPSKRAAGWLINNPELNPVLKPIYEGSKQTKKSFYTEDIIRLKHNREWRVKAEKIIKEKTRKNNGYLS